MTGCMYRLQFCPWSSTAYQAINPDSAMVLIENLSTYIETQLRNVTVENRRHDTYRDMSG